MELGNLFKVDHWWKLALLCGILLTASSLIFDIQFIERRYMLGLGLGMVLIGIGYWMAKKVAHVWANGGVYFWDIFQHTWITKTMIGIGILISLYFFIRILILLAI